MTDREIVTCIVDRFEGGFVDDPHDRGRATHWGVTQATLGRVWGLGHDATIDQVRALGREDAVAILLQAFVYGCGFDRIADWRLRFAAVDYGINSGTARAARTLQRIVGVTPDGVLGPVSLAAINGLSADQVQVAIARSLADRLRFIGRLTALPLQSRFAAGWCDRVATILELVSGADIASRRHD